MPKLQGKHWCLALALSCCLIHLRPPLTKKTIRLSRHSRQAKEREPRSG